MTQREPDWSHFLVRLEEEELFFGYLAGLKPAHRLASLHFRERGILVPFSVDVSHFTEPNRLLFSPEGDWLTLDNANPLYGWDTSAIWSSGSRYGVDPADVYGCLFFHVKDQFREFARRVRDFRIDIHLTQFDATLLSQGIAQGMLQPFEDNCFDRVETSNLADYIGTPRLLNDWGPLLNRQNKHATLLMYFMNWHTKQPGATAKSDSLASMRLLERAALALGVNLKQEALCRAGRYSPGMCRTLDTIEAFHDNNSAFQQYLDSQDTNSKASAQGLRLRPSNRIHPKRFGVPLNATRQKLPNLSREEFYELFVIGGCDYPVRFLEFEKL